MKKNHKLDESQKTSQVIQLLLFGENNMLHSEKQSISLWRSIWFNEMSNDDAQCLPPRQHRYLCCRQGSWEKISDTTVGAESQECTRSLGRTEACRKCCPTYIILRGSYMPHATCTGRRDIHAAYLDVMWNLTRFRGCWDRTRDGSWN